MLPRDLYSIEYSISIAMVLYSISIIDIVYSIVQYIVQCMLYSKYCTV